MASAGSVFVVGKYVNRLADPSASRQAHGYLEYLLTQSEAVPEAEHLTAFDGAGERLEPDAAHARLDEWEHRYLNFVEDLSPHPNRHGSAAWEPHEWREWAGFALGELAHRHPEMEYLAVHHDDPQHPHVQLIVATQTTLRKAELSGVRRAADEAAEAVNEARAARTADPMLGRYREAYTRPEPSDRGQQPALSRGQTLVRSQRTESEADPEI